MGKLVVIEGLDGSGKATQTSLVAQELAAAGKKVRKISFPDYTSRSSALVQMYLAGEFGSRPEDVNAYAASAFYAVDRYASYKKEWGRFYAEGGLLVADRYTTSNAIHQCAKLPREEWEEYIAWLRDFEYKKLGVPQPDLVVYLDVEPQVSQQLLLQRYGDDAKKDIHEQDVAYLMQCREAALWCAEKLSWVRIVCSENGHMRLREDITKDVLCSVRENI